MSSTERRRVLPAYLMLVPLALYIGTFALYPLFDLVLMSFREVRIGNIISGDRPFIGLENFAKVLEDPRLLGAAGVSFAFAIGSLVLQVPAAVFFATLIHLRVPGHKIGMGILLLGWALPPVTIGAAIRLITNSDVGVLNSILVDLGILSAPVSWLADPATVLPTLILVHSWSYIPFAALLIYGGLKGLPHDIYEAAEIDGAGPLRSFFSITLPLLRPVLLIVSLLVVIISFRVFDVIVVLTGGGPNDRSTTLPFHAYREAFVRNDFGAGAAISVLTLVVLALVAVAYVIATRREDPES